MLDKLNNLLREELKSLGREDVYELANEILNKINEEALKTNVMDPHHSELLADARSIYDGISIFNLNVTCYERIVPYDNIKYYAYYLVMAVDKLSIKYGIKGEKELEKKVSTK